MVDAPSDRVVADTSTVALRCRLRVGASIPLHTYSYLYQCAKFAYEQRPKADSSEDDVFRRITHLTFLALAIEAFLNHCGFMKIPWWDVAERSMSTEAKIAVISHLAGLTFDPGRRPMQSLQKLNRFRNEIAHGKTASSVAERQSDQTGHIGPKWLRQIEESDEDHLHDDVIVFASSVYEALGLTADHPMPFNLLRRISVATPPNSAA